MRMNPSLQKYGVTKYLQARNPNFSPDTTDLVALIDSSLGLSENCKNLAAQLGISDTIEEKITRYESMKEAGYV